MLSDGKEPIDFFQPATTTALEAEEILLCAKTPQMTSNNLMDNILCIQ